MLAAVKDYEADAGSAWFQRIRLYIDCNPVPFTGATPRMHVRKTCDSIPVLSFSEAEGTIVGVDLSKGEFTLYQPADNMLAGLVGSYFYDLVMCMGQDTTRILTGLFTIKRSVTGCEVSS